MAKGKSSAGSKAPLIVGGVVVVAAIIVISLIASGIIVLPGTETTTSTTTPVVGGTLPVEDTTTSPPDDTTSTPIDTTTTSPPEDTTSAPIDTTSPPDDTTSPPEDTTTTVDDPPFTGDQTTTTEPLSYYETSGQDIIPNTFYVSPDGSHILMLESNGTVSFFTIDTNGKRIVWERKQDNCSNPMLAFQGDGNIVLYCNGKVGWAEDTQYGGSGSGYRLRIYNEGKIVWIDGNGQVIWQKP